MGQIISYLRVSTGKQGKSGLGIEAQRETIARFAATEGTREALEVAKTKGKCLGNPNIDAIRDQAAAATKAISDRYAENTLPIVRQIQASGITGLRGIARALAARGVATARRGQWTPVQVSNLLKRAAR
jgi:DNA invertase Pin-like site-specific DNA recombinase